MRFDTEDKVQLQGMLIDRRMNKNIMRKTYEQKRLNYINSVRYS